MESTVKTSDLKKQLKEMQNQQALNNLQSNLTRARSVSVGNALGGVTEVSLRGDGDKHLWVLLSPAEVIELIHQLAGNIGCHIHVKPRDDFSSWRQWKETNEQPLINSNVSGTDKLPHTKIEQNNSNGLKEPLRSKKNVMATEKNINQSSPKRTAKAS